MKTNADFADRQAVRVTAGPLKGRRGKIVRLAGDDGSPIAKVEIGREEYYDVPADLLRPAAR